MNSSPANVSPFSSVRTKLRQSSIADPNVVVRQFPPRSGVGLASTMMYNSAQKMRRPDGEPRQQASDIDVGEALAHPVRTYQAVPNDSTPSDYRLFGPKAQE